MDKRLLSLVDYTSLKDTDTKSSIEDFCFEALHLPHPIAAICIYPQFVSIARKALGRSEIKLATVANFPSGNLNEKEIKACVSRALDEGADEIDLVLPYQAYLTGDEAFAFDVVSSTRNLCADRTLKVIIESGALNLTQVHAITTKLIDLKVDFVKTSTGKIKTGATEDAVLTILHTFKDNLITPKSACPGIKISGGISSKEIALNFLNLTQCVLGEDWIKPSQFRFGLSKLVF